MSGRIAAFPATALALVLAAAPAAVGAPSGPGGRTIALVGGDVYPVSGPMIRGGTVLIRGERIAAVGAKVAVPEGAERVDCTGRRVTPGLIESDTAIGMVEISMEPSTVDAAHGAGLVRAALDVADAIDVRSAAVGVARRQGVTSAVSAPAGGIISGQSAWIDLVDPDAVRAATDAVSPLGPPVVRRVAMHGALDAAAAAMAGGSRALTLLWMRRIFDDVRTYERERGAFERNQLRNLLVAAPDLEALRPVVHRRMRLVLAASRAADIRAALALARAEDLDLALLGAEEGWLVARELAAAHVPVIVQPNENLPEKFEARNARADNAALLVRAGVPVAISTRSTHAASNLRFLLGTAVRAGLAPDRALEAATLVPARIYGREAMYGAIEPGKAANLVVWTGDPFEPAAHAETIIVRGELQPTADRQTRLAERYIERYRLRGARTGTSTPAGPGAGGPRGSRFSEP